MTNAHRIAILFALTSTASLGCDAPAPSDDASVEIDASAVDANTSDARTDALALLDAPALDANADVGSTTDAGDHDAGDHDAGTDAGEDIDAGHDAGSDAGIDAGRDAGSDAGHDAGSDAGHDAGSDAGMDAGSDAGHDAGSDAGMDAGRDAGSDAGRDAGSDAGRDGGRDAYTPPDPCSPLPSGLTTRVINDSASAGTPDTYTFNVNPGDPFCASITGGGSDPWQVIVSNGTSSGIYCSGDASCGITVPSGQTALLVTATNEGAPAFYRLTVHYIPRL